MSPKVWVSVAIVALLGGVGAAYVAETGVLGGRPGEVALDGGTQPMPGEPEVSASSSAESNSAASSSSDYNQTLSTINRDLPQFSLRALDDTVWNIESLRGKPWVINFWATWCPPCIEEIPSMNRAYEYLEPQGIGMLAINAGEGAGAVVPFMDRVSFDFPHVLGDANTLVNWSVRALPTTIVIDAEGNIVFEALGPREWDDRELLQPIVDLL